MRFTRALGRKVMEIVLPVYCTAHWKLHLWYLLGWNQVCHKVYWSDLVDLSHPGKSRASTRAAPAIMVEARWQLAGSAVPGLPQIWKPNNVAKKLQSPRLDSSTNRRGLPAFLYTCSLGMKPYQ